MKEAVLKIAPVVQRIGRLASNQVMGVRFSPGAQNNKKINLCAPARDRTLDRLLNPAPEQSSVRDKEEAAAFTPHNNCLNKFCAPTWNRTKVLRLRGECFTTKL